MREADAILRSCVHCGFCTAVCPTYQLLGDELDGPRGRIYLIKDMLEDNDISRRSTAHIDRCLTCRACETACPSGVRYGRLVDIGRGIIAEKSKPGPRVRMLGGLLRWVVPEPGRIGPLLRLGQFVRNLLPAVLRRQIPAPQPPPHYPMTTRTFEKRVIVLQGCVQRAATPNVNAALEYLLATKEIGVEYLDDEGCCGALDYHLAGSGAQAAGKQRMRALIDSLYARLGDVDAIVSTASGCGVTVKEYPEVLATDEAYRDKARAVADKCVDASEYLGELNFEARPRRVAFQAPCSLQHGQRINGVVEDILDRAGFELVPVREGHLCCGSAGTYSLLQPALSRQLRARKLEALADGRPAGDRHRERRLPASPGRRGGRTGDALAGITGG